MLNRVGCFFLPFICENQIISILLSLPLKQNSCSEASESWLFMSSDKFKTNLPDRNIFSYSISVFIPVIKIAERNKFTICLKTPFFCSWSCNLYRIWCCFCSGCVRAPVESLWVCQSRYQHVTLEDKWFSSSLSTCSLLALVGCHISLKTCEFLLSIT